jgi:hypothetical protein
MLRVVVMVAVIVRMGVGWHGSWDPEGAVD